MHIHDPIALGKDASIHIRIYMLNQYDIWIIKNIPKKLWGEVWHIADA